MADLTVLISPTPLPKTNSFGRFTRRDSPVSRPIMVTLQMADTDTNPSSSSAPSSPTKRNFNEALLSPPRNTFKSRPRPHPGSLPPRPASAPPQRTRSSFDPTDPEVPTEGSRKLFAIERRKISSFSSSNTKSGELIRPAPPLCELFLSFACY